MYRGRPWGHILDDEHGRAGRNFVHPAAHRALLLRAEQGKGGGVDHDLLFEYVANDATIGLLAIEMKFVEESFSCCGFRPGGRDTCPGQVPVALNRDACLYVKKRRYLYWQRSDELGVLGERALASSGCPFGGPQWQLWVNTVLVQALAKERGARATFAVCAPAANDALLGPRHDVISGFKDLLAQGIDFRFVALEDVLDELAAVPWYEQLDARYRIGASPARKARPAPTSR